MWRSESTARRHVFEEGRGNRFGKDAHIGVKFKSLISLERVVSAGVVEHTSAFGVGSVWMNMVRRVMVADGEMAH